MYYSIKQKVGFVLANPLWSLTILIALTRGFFIKCYYHIIKPGKVHIGKNFRAYSKISIIGPGKVFIGDNFRCSRTMMKYPIILTHSKDARVRIGFGSYLGGTQISCVNRIECKEKILFANTLIMDSDIIPEPNMKIDTKWINENSAPIIIGNQCWLGMNSTVLKGVTIGDECVLGAGSVAIKNADPFSLLLGNPARMIGKTREPE